ncbi:MAG: MAPEG family protein [Steroidobacteraceae bacterium]
MAVVDIVIALALLQYFWFGLKVGRARGQFRVQAPATTGHPDFERVFRVHMNTLEQLVMFVPGIWMFAHYVHAYIAAGLGVIYLVGRFMFSSGYTRAADRRGLGFGVSAFPVIILVTGGLIGAAVALYRSGL